MGGKGLLCTIVTSLPERDQALTENLQVQLPQTFIKHLLCTRHSARHISYLCHLSRRHLMVAQVCFLGGGRLGSEA